MKHIGIRILQWIYGYFFLAVLYCAIYVQVTHNPERAFWNTFLFIPIIFICSISVDYDVKFYQYMLISMILLFGVYEAGLKMTGSLGHTVFLVCVAAMIVFLYFLSKAQRRTCLLERTHYLGLLFYLMVCFYANTFDSEFLMKMSCLAAGFHYLVVNICTNYQHMGLFIQDYEKLDRLPVSRMNKNNNRMLWIQTVINSGAMIAAPYCRLDRIIRKLIISLRTFLIWIMTMLSRMQTDETEQMQPPAANGNFQFDEVVIKENLFFKIMDMLLQIAGWILIGFLLFLLIRFLVKKMLELYSQFNTRTDDNGDLVENLMNGNKMEDGIHAAEEKKENLFLNWSPDARIRKIYKKRIQGERKSEIHDSWTPQQLEEGISLTGEKKERFHVLYEKARYSMESCTKEDAQEMKGI